MSAEAPGNLFSSKVSYLVVPTKAAGFLFTAKETEAQRAEGPTPGHAARMRQTGARPALSLPQSLCAAQLGSSRGPRCLELQAQPVKKQPCPSGGLMVLKSCPPAPSTRELAPTPAPDRLPTSCFLDLWPGRTPARRRKKPQAHVCPPRPHCLQVTDKTSAHLPHQAGGRCT